MIHVFRTLIVLGGLAAFASPAQAATFSDWADVIDAELIPGTSDQLNTDRLDGCPMQSPDGLSLYMASTRKRSADDDRTDIDIWVAQRASTDDPWGAPVNLGAPINTTDDDFCPTPVRGRGLFFVSRKVVPGVTCGAGDIYFTRNNPARGWREPRHLPCAVDGGPNTALDEQGPSYVEAEDPSLYYSSGPDVYISERGADGSFGLGTAVAELNSPAGDIQPNVRKDGREVVFASNRNAGTGQDIWTSARASTDVPWSAPVRLGSAVNTEANETRPSLSWDATTLYFGRAPGLPVTGDIFVATRHRSGG